MSCRKNISPESIAYERGYRITEHGYLYRLDGFIPKKHFHCGGYCFCAASNVRVRIVRFLSYCHDRVNFNKYKFIGLKNLDPSDIRLSNLDYVLDKKQRYNYLSAACCREESAVLLGYSLDKKGNLIYLGFPVLKDRSAKYKSFSLRLKGASSVKIYYHRLQAYLKYGKDLINNDVIVRHLDGNPLNNSWDNILIGTHLDNRNDWSETLEKSAAVKRSVSRKRYNENVRQEIRDLFDRGWSYPELMKKFSYSKSTIYRINVKERAHG